MSAGNYWGNNGRGRVSRRRLLQAGSLGAVALSPLALAACSSSNNNGGAKATTAATQAPASATAAGAATSAGVAGTARSATAGSPAAAASSAAVPAKKGGTFQVAATGSPPTLDPFATQSFATRGFGGGVYSSLFNPKGVPVDQFPSFEVNGDAAESYELSNDGLTYNIKLRNNVKFHPPVSRLMTSADVKFAFDRFMGNISGTKAAPNIDQFNMVDSVTTPDPSHVVFKLKQPFATFINRLADEYNLLLMPPETGTAFDPTQTMVGSGPSIFVENVPSKDWKVKRNPEWHGGPDMPYLDGLTSNVIPEYATTFNQFLAGNLDAVTVATADDLLKVRDQVKNVKLTGVLSTYLAYISFSGLDPNAPWKDPRVRQAVAMSLDYDAIFDALYDAKRLSTAGLKIDLKQHNLIPAGLGKYWLDPKGSKIDPAVKKFFTYDPQGAKQLLSAAGVPDGFSANYHYPNIYGAVWVRCAELLPQFVGKIGIKLNLVLDDYTSVYVTKTFTGDYDGLAFQYQGFPLPDDYLTSMYTPGAARNHRKVNDQTILTRAADIQKTLDDAQRTQKILDIQNYLGQQMYYVPAVYDSGPAWTARQPYVMDAEKYLTSRSGGNSVGTPHTWFSK